MKQKESICLVVQRQILELTRKKEKDVEKSNKKIKNDVKILKIQFVLSESQDLGVLFL